MNYNEDEIYVDRSGKKYKYLQKGLGGTLIFEDLITNKNIVQHSSGMYRWDGKEHHRDLKAEI